MPCSCEKYAATRRHEFSQFCYIFNSSHLKKIHFKQCENNVICKPYLHDFL